MPTNIPLINLFSADLLKVGDNTSSFLSVINSALGDESIATSLKRKINDTLGSPVNITEGTINYFINAVKQAITVATDGLTIASAKKIEATGYKNSASSSATSAEGYKNQAYQYSQDALQYKDDIYYYYKGILGLVDQGSEYFAEGRELLLFTGYYSDNKFYVNPQMTQEETRIHLIYKDLNEQKLYYNNNGTFVKISYSNYYFGEEIPSNPKIGELWLDTGNE